MMAVLGVILYLIYLAVCIALAVMGLTLAYMPYVLGGIASLIIYSQNPGIQTWIPGHPWMCFIVLLALVEAGIAVLMHIKHVSRAVITFFCCVFMGAIGAVVFEELTPDSMGYCLFVSVVYLLLSVFAVRVNLRNLPKEHGSRGILAGILSGALYGLSAVSLFGFLAEGIWKPYFVGLGRSANRIEMIINTMCVVGAVLILLAVVIFGRNSENEQDMLYL